MTAKQRCNRPHAIGGRDSDEGVIHLRGSLKRAVELLKDLVDRGKACPSQQHSLGSHCTHERPSVAINDAMQAQSGYDH